MKMIVALLAVAGLGLSQASGSVAYVSGSGGEPWGMPGNINALNDVFGAGNWDRLDLPTAVGQGLWNYNCIIIDGGNGADVEFVNFVNANRADLEAWVAAGGNLIIGASRWGAGPSSFDLGFGINLVDGSNSNSGTAVDVFHPVFDGPFGFTGPDFTGDHLSHDYLTGSFNALMLDASGNVILAEKGWGAGWVIAHGLTLPFFGEHPLWSPNSADFHRNLFYYGCTIPAPASLALLGLAGLAVRRRRR